MTGFDLIGRRVVVTGAAAGIGRATAEMLMTMGVRVHAVDRDAGGLGSLAGAAATYVADLADSEQVQRVVAELRAAVPELDGLVNNAGITPRSALAELTNDRFDDCLGVNLAAPVQFIRGLTDSLAVNGGSVVNMASIHAHTTAPGLTAYAASKAGLTGITRALALELGPRGIRVNAIAPGYIDTGYVSGYAPGVAESIRRQHPVQRLGRPDDIAGVVAFLLADASGFVNGAVIPVDGGLCARMSAMVADWVPATT